MIGNKVHFKDEKVIENLSILTEAITNNLAAIAYLNSVMDKYKESKPGHIDVLESIKADHMAENYGIRSEYFAAVRALLLDESPDFPLIMNKKVLIKEKEVLVVDHLMNSLNELFEKFFSKIFKPDTFTIQFEHDDMQGLDMLSIDMEIKSLIRELELFEVLGFVLTSKHDPENLTITVAWEDCTKE